MDSRMWENNITGTKTMVCEYRLGFKNSGQRPQVGGLL